MIKRRDIEREALQQGEDVVKKMVIVYGLMAIALVVGILFMG